MRTGVAAIIILLLAACSQEPPPAGPSVSNAWVREAPTGTRMTAGYMTVHNPGKDEIQVVGVQSEDFGSIELHTTVTEDGVAKMRMEGAVAVPAGGMVSFEPGGRHLMLFDPARPLTDGDTVTLTVLLSDGSQIRAESAVLRGEHTSHEH